MAEKHKPEGLADALQKLATWHRVCNERGLTDRDLHPKVLAYLLKQAEPVGRGGRKAYSEWQRCVAKQSFDMWKSWAQVLIPAGGELDVKNKRVVLRAVKGSWKLKTLGRGTPSEVALHIVGAVNSRDWTTIRDMVYRKKQNPNK